MSIAPGLVQASSASPTSGRTRSNSKNTRNRGSFSGSAAGGDIRLGAGSWVYTYADPVDGGVPLLTCDNVQVATGGGISGADRSGSAD